ncbi:MAG: prepilin-type N-terminal cleavage/methylation domain-containing protein [Sedimentisphaerales bacterium]|nr:prepilin-type N-terminal cleavage/methylation domain-containing protein [Sedimentisphaerales bacterium]
MKSNGFSLVEVLFAILLVGLAIAALLGANAAFTRANGAGTDLSTAEFLLEQIKELTATLAVIDPQTETTTFGPEEATVAAYDDLDDFDGAVFSPPISAHRTTLTDFTAFTQQITVENVSASNFALLAADHSTAFVRVTASVLMNSTEISSASWIRARY